MLQISNQGSSFFILLSLGKALDKYCLRVAGSVFFISSSSILAVENRYRIPPHSRASANMLRKYKLRSFWADQNFEASEILSVGQMWYVFLSMVWRQLLGDNFKRCLNERAQIIGETYFNYDKMISKNSFETRILFFNKREKNWRN